MIQNLLSPAQVGEMVGLREATIRRRKGEIGWVDFGKSIMFKPEKVQKWIDSKSTEPEKIRRPVSRR